MKNSFKVPKIEKLTYNLPHNRIAKYPLTTRDQSKLLVYKNKQISNTQFSHLAQELQENDLLIFNNTKVIQARLRFKKQTGANIEIFLLEPAHPIDYNLIFQTKNTCQWTCIVGNAKKWKTGKLHLHTEKFDIYAEKVADLGKGEFHIQFSWTNNVLFADVLEKIGNMPIPPYLEREAEETDKETYQTVYSKIDGSVAAPTSGLHFTHAVFSDLKNKGIKTAELTLHVGAGTFRPIKEDDAAKHPMHAEQFFASIDFIKKIANHKGRVITVGTTALRSLESLYYLGVLAYLDKLEKLDFIKIKQWDIYNIPKNISRENAFAALANKMEHENREQIFADTQIMITPLYKVKSIEGIITNFHQPESTLLLLVASLVGNNWHNIYNYALENDFRFLSYGDSSLLFLEN